ncbi:peptide/nickel transport system substrate-binding protein [Amycolatopsis bartoniae]|uniref:ABC transporter substrate-binding protein n=1 Tax=Amycolatopsis bartoniae TaxID=941986 RepID=A0A8H9M7L4_9PSEU|nr:ABC transporter substrate-binding protein [Amycolatopsis bartoniae]MBB2935241.1 peptide/nickel transport system substrate-binding protein [Amycolatopsis bartoniae]TVT04051.1 ABC transporter substrate-binding protein [Amycolatopsis bartoniae]GHF75333.1 ABC transporter substrate-binding protein [Amycolatopsis bartoniae]
MLPQRVARWRRLALIGLSGALAVSMSACASERGSGGGADDTFVFGAAGAPKNFDPIFNDDGESFRPVRQMFDTLVTYKPGTTELEGDLATAWTPSPDGKSWTFTLRQGVKFHDGTPFNAAAVCFNFDRWYNMKGAAAQSQMIYYGDVFEGFAKNEGDATGSPVYKSCEAKDDLTAVVNLNKAKGAFPDAFGLTSLSISSPDALKKYDADNVTQSGDSFTYPAYANEHPTGTGPYKFESYDKTNKTITLVRNDDYWGEKAKTAKLIFKIIEDENARKQELAAGTIDGYDFPSPADYNSLKDAGNQVLIRPAFNILYLGINQKNNPKLQDVRVRKAIEYAINKDQLAKNKLPSGAYAQTQFLPNNVPGYTDAVEKHSYDPNQAKALLQQAGATGLTLNFYVPTEVTRPYMPNPVDIGGAIADDLKAVGINVNIVQEPWNGGYKDDVQKAGKQDLHLLGWTGDYADAGNFVGTFFGRQKAEFGFDNPQIFSALANADSQVTPDAKKTAYEQASVLISQYVPAIPLTSSPPAIVVKSNIHNLIPTPLTDERFYTVTKG